MQIRHVTLLIGLWTSAVQTAVAQIAAPEKPHLIMWPLSADVGGPNSGVARDPTSAIPIVRDDRNTGENRGPVYTPEQAAAFAYGALAADYSNNWIDGTHLALFPRYIGADVFVQDDAAPSPYPQNPDTDPRTVRDSTAPGYDPWPSAWTFFYPNDRLVGLYDHHTASPPGAPAFPGTTEQDFSTNQTTGARQYHPGAGNRSYRHPFLVNATRNDQDPEHNSPLREYMRAYAAALRSQLDAPGSPLQGAQPTFIFDAEQAHIVQRPDKHSCIYMLWFLTQAKVPGASPTSTDENDFIWNRFKVPGSEGWRPPTRSEIYDNAPIAAPDTGFVTTTGRTLAELYHAEALRQNPPAWRQVWPQNPSGADDEIQYWPTGTDSATGRTERDQLRRLLERYANSTGALPDHPAVRGIMLWWMEVCAKAEGAIWENAVFGPLHEEFPNSTFINYTQMTTDGKVDTSSTVHDLGVLPTPAWPDNNWLYPYPQGASEPEYPARATGGLAPLTSELPRAVWSAAGANAQWRDGGPIAADGTQRRVNFFPQHIRGRALVRGRADNSGNIAGRGRFHEVPVWA